MISLSLITNIPLCSEKKVNQLHLACLPAYNIHLTLLTTVVTCTSPTCISATAKASKACINIWQLRLKDGY